MTSIEDEAKRRAVERGFAHDVLAGFSLRPAGRLPAPETFEDYALFVRSLKKWSNSVYPVLGLAGETGEVVDAIKKRMRSTEFPSNVWRDEEILLELGDVLYYLTAIAYEFGWTMDEVVQANRKKLTDRQRAGTVFVEKR